MKLGSVLLACFVSIAVAQSAPKRPARPDVYLITIDTLRSDHLRCYGYDKISTPTIDLLAKDGIRFTQAFTPSPITNTSHTSILTGLLPSAHGVTDFGVPLAPTHVTLAELLKEQGYKTAAFIGAVILDSKSLAPGLGRGFDFYDNFPEKSITKPRWGRVERRGMDVVQHAQTWLTAHTGPRFVWVHLYDPHDPYEPPAPFSEQYKDRPYDGEIAYADSALGNLLSYLKKTGFYANAIIIVVGDHGEGLGEHNEQTHGLFLYDSTTHVPLIIKLPSEAKRESTVSAQVRTIDILPTVLDLIHAPAPASLNGESLTPYFTAEDKTDRPAVGETDYPLEFGWAPLKSIRSGGYKFIEAPRPELYNLQADPSELHNQFAQQDPQAEKLRQTLVQLTPNANRTEAASLPDPKDRIEEQNFLHTAMMAVEDGDAAKARSALQRVLKLDNDSATALLGLGKVELEAGNFAQAAAYLQRARKLRPDDPNAAYDCGRALEQAGDLSAAREALEASLKLNATQFPARILLGRVLSRMQDPRNAEDQFQAALLMQPENLEAHLSLSRALLDQRRFADAAVELEPLAASHPREAEVHKLLAEAYRGMGKTKQADLAEQRAKALTTERPKP